MHEWGAWVPRSSRKVDVRLPEKGNSNSHGARPVHLNHHDDLVDSDQLVDNKDLSLYLAHEEAHPPSTLQYRAISLMKPPPRRTLQ